MRLVSAAKHAALRAGYDLAIKRHDDALRLAEERQATITRQAGELARLRDEHPDSLLPQPPATAREAELQRLLYLERRTVAALAQRLDEMQASHIADTRELHDLRQNGAAS